MQEAADNHTDSTRYGLVEEENTMQALWFELSAFVCGRVVLMVGVSAFTLLWLVAVAVTIPRVCCACACTHFGFSSSAHPLPRVLTTF